MAACLGARVGADPPRPVDYIFVALDRSESTASFRPLQLRWLDVVVREAANLRVPVMFFVYAKDPVLAWGPAVPNSVREFREPKWTQTQAGKDWRVTRQAAMLDAIAATHEFISATAPRVYCFSDGDDDDFNDAKRLPAALKPFSQKLHTTLSLIGIDRPNEVLWTKLLDRAMAGRYDLVEKDKGTKFIFGSF